MYNDYLNEKANGRVKKILNMKMVIGIEMKRLFGYEKKNLKNPMIK